MRALCVVVGLLGIVFEDDAARVRCRLHYSCIVSMDRSPLRAGKAASRSIHMCTMLIFFAGDWYRTDCNRCPRDYRAQTLVAKLRPSAERARAAIVFVFTLSPWTARTAVPLARAR